MIRLFNEAPLSQALRGVMNKADNAVKGVNGNILLNRGIDEVANGIVSKLKLPMLNITFDSRTSDTAMVGGTVRVEYTLPIVSGIELLSVRPSTRTFVHDVGVEVSQQAVKIYCHTRYVNIQLSDAVIEEVKRIMTPIFEELPKMQEAINNEIQEFNEIGLKQYVVEHLTKFNELLNKQQAQNKRLNDL